MASYFLCVDIGNDNTSEFFYYGPFKDKSSAYQFGKRLKKKFPSYVEDISWNMNIERLEHPSFSVAEAFIRSLRPNGESNASEEMDQAAT